jgi:hypothetical protein
MPGFIANLKHQNMGKKANPELTEKLESGIISILQEFNPTLGSKLKKEAHSAGKEISKKMAEMQADIEKKAKKAFEKQARAAKKAQKEKVKTDKKPKDKKPKK